MTQKVAVLRVGAGIQRDGTTFAAGSSVAGNWVRLQAGRPRNDAGPRPATRVSVGRDPRQ